MRRALAIAAWACAAAASGAQVIANVDDGEPLSRALAQTGLDIGITSDPMKVLAPGAIALIAGTQPTLAQVAAASDSVERFTGAGGWLVIVGVARESLTPFNRLVGVDHLLRPFRSEVVAPASPQHPLMKGISADDLAMRTDGNQPWAAPVAVAENAYSAIVDLDNVAPFAAIPGPEWFKHQDGENDRNPFNLVDGFTEADGGWRRAFVFYLERSRRDFELALPRPTELAAVEWTGSMVYPGIRRVEVIFDGDATSAKPFDAPQGVQSVRIEVSPPRTVTRVGFRLVDTIDNGRGAVGVDEIRLIQTRPAATPAIQPLTSIGALVAYPRGSGGLLLCQLRFADDDEPRIAERKLRVLKRLLMNLGASQRPAGSSASVSGPGMRAPTAMKVIGEPVALGAAHPLSGDWLGDTRHSFAFAQGDLALRGLRFHVDGARLAGDPEGIAVGRKATALVFLQAAAVPGGAAGRRLARYRIVYADGHIAEVPVAVGIDIADCLQREPRPLPRAQIAWIARAGDQGFAVAYARQWDNPTPEVAIERVELVADEPAAVLALIGLTALPVAGK